MDYNYIILKYKTLNSRRSDEATTCVKDSHINKPDKTVDKSMFMKINI